jgi:ribose transport system ATP-binding protein
MEVTGLWSAKLRGISFALGPGEALGFAGLVGSGLQELPYLLVGASQASSGQIRVGRTTAALRTMTPLRATSLGVGLVPGDRMREGLLGTRSVAENISLPQLRRFQRRGLLRRQDERAFGQRWVDDLHVTPADPGHEVRLLSGGNQQKVLLAKWLQLHPRLLIAIEPTQGVDVGARGEIFSLLKDYAAQGSAIVCCSTDTDQLAELCDVVCVMHAGRLGQVLRGADVARELITAAVLDASLPGGAEPP